MSAQLIDQDIDQFPTVRPMREPRKAIVFPSLAERLIKPDRQSVGQPDDAISLSHDMPNWLYSYLFMTTIYVFGTLMYFVREMTK